jgi:GNAT superfamily N-acetyltransferase
MTITAEVEFSSDKRRLDISLIHSFLKNTYWSPGIPREVVERAIAGSICFGMYKEGAQVGFARLITDEATFAYLADVFVLENERGKGYGKALVAHVTEVAKNYNLRRILLATADAHGLYRTSGFTELKRPDMFMEISRNDIYLRATAAK